MLKSNLISGNTVRFAAKGRTVGHLCSEFDQRIAKILPKSGRIAFVSDSALELISAAAWMAHTAADGLVLSAERLNGSLAADLRAQGFHLLNIPAKSVLAPAAQAHAVPGRVTLLTSGTTGEPKLVEHTWQSLFTMAKVRAAKPANWLLTYQPGTYAWYQMLTLVLFVPNQNLTLASERTPAAFFQSARQNEVTAISSTPTLWRLALLQIPTAELKALKLQQITLGGEAVDQGILDQLRKLYPGATLTQIYASTEAGACIVVNDGQEGFPAVWLVSNGSAQATPAAPRLQVRDGFLWVQSPYALRHQSGWFNSGDRIEVRGGRAIILGRAETAFINVGGAKVPAQEVERILLQHPAVLWCRVRRCPAPLVGELVGADVVFRPGEARPSATDLTKFCAARLAEHMVPRVWNILDQIPVTENLKSKLA